MGQMLVQLLISESIASVNRQNWTKNHLNLYLDVGFLEVRSCSDVV